MYNIVLKTENATKISTVIFFFIIKSLKFIINFKRLDQIMNHI